MLITKKDKDKNEKNCKRDEDEGIGKKLAYLGNVSVVEKHLQGLQSFSSCTGTTKIAKIVYKRNCILKIIYKWKSLFYTKFFITTTNKSSI